MGSGQALEQLGLVDHSGLYVCGRSNNPILFVALSDQMPGIVVGYQLCPYWQQYSPR